MFLSGRSPATSLEEQPLLPYPQKKLQWKNWGDMMCKGDGDQGDLSLPLKIVLDICKSREVSRGKTAGFFSSLWPAYYLEIACATLHFERV